MKKTILANCIILALSSTAGWATTSQTYDTPPDEFEDEFSDESFDFYGGEEFISIATGTKKRIDKAPAVATIITAEMINHMGAQDIDEVLETVPGLHVNRTSNGNEPLYTFRGVFSRFNPQVLMLVNGFPITNVFVGNRSQGWGGMPVTAIARIEVIRGPGSAVYGADAFSGVINIISKSHADISQNSIGLSYGKFDTKGLWMSYATEIGSTKFALNYEFLNTDGYDAIIEADQQTRLDNIFGTSASLAPGNMRNGRKMHEMRFEVSNGNLLLRAGVQRRDRQPGVGITDTLAPITNTISDRYNLDLTYTWKLSKDSQFKVEASHFRTTQEYDRDLVLFPPGSDLGLGGPFPEGVIGNPEVFERHARLYTTYSYTGFDDHQLRFGAGYNHGDIYRVQERKNFALGPNGEFLAPGSPVVDVSDTPFVFLPEVDRENYYLFAQDIWQIANDWELTAGIRHDDYSDFGSTTNPRVALVWSSSLNTTSKFLYGRAFRAPSFANLFNINNPAALGNPDLSPETIETFEYSINHRIKSVNLSASLFHYQWEDIIAFVQNDGTSVSIAQNTGEVNGSGFELEASWKISDVFSIKGNYSYQNSEIQGSNEDAPYAPGKQLYVESNYDISDALHANVSLNHVSDRVRAALDPRSNIDDYTRVNASLTWAPQKHDFKIQLRIKNLFDDDSREPTFNSGSAVNLPNDLPLSGRDISVSATYYFE